MANPEVDTSVEAVAAWIDDESAPLGGIVGSSFGAAVSLIWQAEADSSIPNEKEYDSVTSWTNQASDHGAVWADFEL